MIQLSRYEQETIINYNREEQEATICSADPVILARLEKISKKYPNSYKLIDENLPYKTYSCPKKLIRFGAPNTKVYTEEEKQKLREQLAKTRQQ